jgi:hypothetical protein
MEFMALRLGLRAGLRQRGFFIFPFPFPALIPQRASAPSEMYRAIFIRAWRRSGVIRSSLSCSLNCIWRITEKDFVLDFQPAGAEARLIFEALRHG